MNYISKVILLVTVFLILISCGKTDHDAAEHAQYTCPMHPTVVSSKPATCPVCGMDLVRKTRPDHELKITQEMRALIESPNQAVVSNVKTISPTYAVNAAGLDVSGVVTYDSRNIYAIPSRVSGRIEKMHVTSEFQRIKKGQLIAEIYSPELSAAQRELLYLVQHDSENQGLIGAARQKLRLLGLAASEIDEIIAKQRIREIRPVYSPYVGFVVQSPNYNEGSMVQEATSGIDAMGEGAAQQSAGSRGGMLLREGEYINAGGTLANVVDDRSILVEFDLPADRSTVLKHGDSLEVDLGHGVKHVTNIDFVQPYFSKGANFLKVRVYIKNSDLRVGELLKARLTLQRNAAVWIPRDAMLSLGTRDIVFIKERNVFKPRPVTIGVRSDQYVEVLRGLASSDEIASSAAFLVDSDGFIETLE